MTVFGAIYAKLLRTPAAVVLACILSGCIMEYGDCPDVFAPGEDSGKITVKFHIVSDGDGRTKAVSDDDFDSENHDSEGSLADESYVDLSDIRVCLFNKTASGSIFLRNLQIQSTGNNAFMTSFSVPLNAIADASGTTASFGIMVLANWGSVGGRYPVMHEMQTSIDDVTDGAFYAFSMAPDWYPGYGARGIPMYGFQTYSGVSIAELRASTEAEPYLLYANGYKDINMLRAMAKVEVADNIRSRTGGYPRIEDVKIRNWSSGGIYIPESKAFSGAYNQVSAPTLPEDQGTYPGARTFRKSAAYATTTPDWNETVMPDGWWTTYCPEIGYSSASSLPVLDILVRHRAEGSAGNGAETQTYTINLPSNFTGRAGMILRNHIYRIEVVNIAAEDELSLVYGICEWDRETVTLPDFD